MGTNRREEIVEAFLKLCSRKGLDNTTMQDVAKEVGISVGAIYLDFKNKNELIDAFIDYLLRRFEFATSQILAQSVTAEQKLYDFLVGNLELTGRQLRQNIGILEFMNVDVIKHIKKNIKEKRVELQNHRVNIIQQILEQGVGEGCFEIDDIPRTAYLIFMALGENFIGQFMWEREHEAVMKDAEDMYALLLKSIKKR